MKTMNTQLFVRCIVVLLFYFVTFHATSQDPHDHSGCRASEMVNLYYQLHPEAIHEREELEQRTHEFIQEQSKSTGKKPVGTSVEKSGASYIIPVVFHVYGSTQNGSTITLEKIQAALVELNKDYNGLNSDFGTVHNTFLSRRGTISIEFTLAQLDPEGNPTTGVEFLPVKGGYGNGGGYDAQIAADAWDNYKYMNVYVQGDIYNDGSTSSSGVAWYPSTSMSDAGTARVVYNGSYLGTNTDEEFASVLTHEFGHFMNLAHTFDLGCTSPTNDNVEDTPPCDQNYDATDICHSSSTANSPLNCSGELINAENYMDYRGRSWKGWVNPDYGCYKMFTQGQIARIEAALYASSRITLWQTSNLIETGLLSSLTASVVISTATNPACVGSNVTFTAVPNNGGTSPAYQWKVNGVNVGTDSPTFAIATLTNGQVVSCVMTSNLAGVLNSPATSNSITMTVSSPLALPLAEGFQGSFIPAGWINSNPDGDILTWVQSTAVGNGSTVSVMINNFDHSASGSIDDLITAKYSLSGVTDANLTFDVAYARYSPTEFDSLIVYASSNCGETWSRIYAKGNSDLATAPDKSSSIFVPSGSTQWRTETISLSSFIGQPDISIKFQNKSYYSQALYLDNINIATITTTVAASVSIAQTSGANPACSGTSVTFVATPINGGTSPVYQWKVDGVNAGINSSTFTTSSLANGQIVTCVMTSNMPGVTNNPATSTGITMSINPSLTASVSIALTAGSNPMCAGSSLTFTATPTNGGTSPAYQWKVNGSNVGSNFSTFSTSAISDGQLVKCEMISDLVCVTPVPAVSSGITMSVSSAQTPAVSIALSTGSNPSCTNSSVTFTATSVNGGTMPSYQWKVNGSNMGTNSPLFSSTSLTNGAQVTCVMTSNSTCATPLTATSNVITMTVNSSVTPSISITSTASSTTICQGSSVTFNASAAYGGSAPAYQWKVNGANQGTNASSLTTAMLTNGQTVTCTLTSNATCATVLSVTSSGITMTVQTTAEPTGMSTQSFCNTATVSNLSASGSSIQWYSSVEGGSVLSGSIPLVNGSVYYATQNVTGCESTTRFPVSVIISNPAAPLGQTNQTFCSSAAVSDLSVTGSSIQWFSTASGGSPLTSMTSLTNGGVYYASQTISGCTSSDRLAVTASITIASTPTGATAQAVCPNSTPVDLEVIGNQIQWYTVASGGVSIPITTLLVNGVTYYASQSVMGCESLFRLGVTVSVSTSPATPSGAAIQNFCGSATVADLTANGTSIVWYGIPTGGSPLVSTTSLSNGSNYYAGQTSVNGCESIIRLAVAVTINSVPNVAFAPLETICETDASITLTQGSPIGGVYSGAGVSGGVFNPSLVSLGTYTITYTYTNVYQCSGTAQASILVEDCVGIEEIDKEVYVIYPNPATDYMNISCSNDLIKAINLFDVSGRLILGEIFSGLEHAAQMDLNGLSNGVYSIQIVTNTNLINSKITVHK